MPAETGVDIPDFKLKAGSKKRKEHFLPKPGPNGKIGMRELMASMLGQLLLIGIFLIGGRAYGKIASEEHRRYKSADKIKREAALRVESAARNKAERAAKAKDKPKYQYDGDLSDLPTDARRGSFKNYVKGKLYGEEPKPQADEPAEQPEAQAQAAQAPEAQPQAAPSAPAAVARAPQPPRQAWRPGKRLAKGGGLSGGIYKGFGETKVAAPSAGAGGGGASGGGRNQSSGVSSGSGAPSAGAMPPGMPAMPGGMPPGMDMNALMKQMQSGGGSPDAVKQSPPGAPKAASGGGAAAGPAAGRVVAGGVRGLGGGVRGGGAAPGSEFRGGAPGAGSDSERQAQSAASAAKLDKTSGKLAKFAGGLESGAGDEGGSLSAGKIFDKWFGEGTVEGAEQDRTLKAAARPAGAAKAAGASAAAEAQAPAADEAQGVVTDRSQPILAEEDSAAEEEAAPAGPETVAGDASLPADPSRTWIRASAGLTAAWGLALALQAVLNMLFAPPLSSGLLSLKQLLQRLLILMGYGLVAAGSTLLGLGSSAGGLLFTGLGVVAVLGASAAYPAVAGAGLATAAVSRGILSSLIPVFGKKDDEKEPKTRKVLIPVA